jgi:F-type H+-transporting ATPase subunit epsilon
MADTLHIKIITAEKTVCDREAAMVIAPAWEGEMGILPEHAAFLCALDSGILKIKTDPKAERPDKVYAVHGGFLRVNNDDILVLATACEPKDAIDADRAKKAKARAEERLKNRDNAEIDAERAEAALKRAVVRLAVAEDSWLEAPKAEGADHKA